MILDIPIQGRISTSTKKTHLLGKCVCNYHVVIVTWFMPQHCGNIHRSRCPRLVFEAPEIGFYFVLIDLDLQLIGELNVDFWEGRHRLWSRVYHGSCRTVRTESLRNVGTKIDYQIDSISSLLSGWNFVINHRCQKTCTTEWDHREPNLTHLCNLTRAKEVPVSSRRDLSWTGEVLNLYEHSDREEGLRPYILGPVPFTFGAISCGPGLVELLKGCW